MSILNFVVLLGLINFTFSWTNCTPANENEDGNIIFLDRHNVYCDVSEAMQGFAIVTPSDRLFQVWYECTKKLAVHDEEQIYMETGWTKAGENILTQTLSTESLKHIGFMCPVEYAVKGWRLITACNGNFFNNRCDIKFGYTYVGIKATSGAVGDSE